MQVATGTSTWFDSPDKLNAMKCTNTHNKHRDIFDEKKKLFRNKRMMNNRTRGANESTHTGANTTLKPINTPTPAFENRNAQRTEE
jgi:hypothetical protein